MAFSRPPLNDHNRLIEEGYEAIEQLREQQINPYDWKFERTHTRADVIENAEALCVENPQADVSDDQKVSVAGRVLQLRKFGKLTFFHLLDYTGEIQICIQKGTDAHEQFKSGVDSGDIIGVSGAVFKTKTGEVTVFANAVSLLTKSVRPLKVKGEAMKDPDARFRQRYADLIVNDEARETFVKRSQIVKTLRNLLEGRGYMEVETPMMQVIHGGAAARPFVTHHNTLDIDLFLRIAPELFLKRLVVGGFEKVYEINRNFRNEGLSTRHNAEFTMLELYTAYWDYRDTMDLTETLLRETARTAVGKLKLPFGELELDFESPFRRVAILDLLREKLNLSADQLSWGMDDSKIPEMEAIIPDEHRPEIMSVANTCDKILLATFEACCEADLIQPTFVIDYPKSLCPLTKSSKENPALAERFELYIAGLEIANAYSELNDPAEQYEMFKQQVEEKAQGDDEAQPMDEDYVRALEYGMPPASGLGIGIDRLVMLLTNNQSIREVILFPTMRPE